MAMKYLGETLDIHAGGIDFIPVHHTNEIAQSEAATGKPFANIWVHGNFITVDGVKLSKSLNNSFTLHDVVAKGYDPLDLRMLFLQSHYRTQADFTWEALAAARTRLHDLQAMADLRWQVAPSGEASAQPFSTAQTAILEALQQDLNTPQALAHLSSVEQFANEHHITTDQKEVFEAFLASVDELFGLKLLSSTDITDQQKHFIQEREKARAQKDWAKSDELRDQLSQDGLLVRDTPHGTIWRRQ